MILKRDLKYLQSDPDRHGNPRLYVRKNGRRIRLREAEGSPEFHREFAAALERLDKPAGAAEAQAANARPKFARGSFGWIASRYFGSLEFQSLDLESQATRRGVIEDCLAEPLSEGDAEPMGNCPLEFFTSKKIKRLRDIKVKAGLPGAANNRRKYLSAMCGWAIENDLMKSNPARDVRRKKYATSGFHTWTLDELRTFLQRHGVGTKARLALCLMLFLGVRRSDAVRLGPSMLFTTTVLDTDGTERQQKVIRFVPHKTRHKRAIESEKPILGVLEDVLASSPCGRDTFLETKFGKPFTSNGFGNWMRDRCDEAGLRVCTAHGLRKLGASIAAEMNATEHQLMAMFDWSTPAQAAVYTKEARRKLLARGGMPLLSVLGTGLLPSSKEVH